MVDHIIDLFRKTHKVKTQQVSRNRGQRCGDIELSGYLVNTVNPVPLVMDLRIDHDRFGSRSYPSINNNLHYPNDLDGSLNETVVDKIRQYLTDYNNRPSTKPYLLYDCHWQYVWVFTWWIGSSFILTDSSGNWPFFCNFRSLDNPEYRWDTYIF